MGAFESSRPEGVQFSVSTTNTTPFVAEADGVVEGVAMSISFGRTAWIGSVVVSPERRRQGMGTAVTERAVEFACQRADTVLLLALEPARRIYERMGFVDDGTYGTWIQPSTSALHQESVRRPSSRKGIPLRKLDSCLRLDRVATGEDRHAYLERGAPSMRFSMVDDGSDSACLAGYSAQFEWGSGSIIARDAEAGDSLVRELLDQNPRARIEFPDANEAGQALMADLGLTRVDDDYRMRLGPPVPGFCPQYIFKVLTPAVG